ncbi:MAG: hypothetical protein LUG44_04210 [Clostridiales bacterium]|nr:hypothetical protein [Clostridiales bacterium]
MNEKIYTMLDELAGQAGCTALRDRYSEVRTSVQQSYIKQFAVLGDVNSGKSKLINILAGEKRLPATVRGNEHDKIVYVESEQHHCRWVELAYSAYGSSQLAEVDSPLWYMDAAIYLLSATAPFSQQDVDAIKVCVAHGVPCSLVLTKLDMIDEEEKGEIIAYVKAQAERYFGSDEVLVVNMKDREATRQAILAEFAAAEDSADIRVHMLAVSYATALKERITAQYNSAKEKVQLVSEREKQAKQALLDEEVAWDKISLEVKSRELQLIEAMSVEMNRLYAECVASLSDKAMLAKSPKDWWEQSLEKEFRRELVRISNQIDRMICTQVANDRDWLVKTVEQQFGSNLSVASENTEARLDDVIFGVAPEQLNSTRATKTIAMVGLLGSVAVLCGVLAYPVVTMHSINALYWKIAGVAVAGTGFWTFFETRQEKDARQQCLKSEMARYILRSRDANIEALQKNIEYGYESMCISIQDLQLATRKAPAGEGDSKVFAQFKALSEMNQKCDEIVNSLLSRAD